MNDDSLFRLTIALATIIILIVFAVSMKPYGGKRKRLLSLWQRKATTVFQWALIAIAIVLVVSIVFNLKAGNDDGDLTNWFTFVIGSIIGIAVAVSIQIYANQMQEESRSLTKRRRNYAIQTLHSYLDNLENVVLRVNGIIANHRIQMKNAQTDMAKENIKENTKLWLLTPDYERNESIRNIESVLLFSNDVLEPDWIKLTREILRFGKVFPIKGDEFLKGIPPATRDEITPPLLSNIRILKERLPNLPV